MKIRVFLLLGIFHKTNLTHLRIRKITYLNVKNINGAVIVLNDILRVRNLQLAKEKILTAKNIYRENIMGKYVRKVCKLL